MTKERSDGYYYHLKENPKILEKSTKKEKLDFTAKDLIMEFDIKTIENSRQITMYKNNSYGFNDTKLFDRINLELSVLSSGSYSADRKNILEIIRDQTLIKPEEFNSDQWVVVFQNGTYDIVSDNFYPVVNYTILEDGTKIKNLNKQGDYFYEIPHDYIEGNFTCRKFKKALVQWIDKKTTSYHRRGNRKLLINDIFEEIGLTLSMNTLFKIAFLNLGPKNSGKTQYTNIEIHIIGKSNCSTQSLQDLCNNRFSTRYLQYRIANIRSENPSSILKNVEMFKALTGDDVLIPAEIKNGPRFQIQVYTTFTFNVNKAPKLRVEDDAFYSRFIINQFPNIFNGEENNRILNYARNHILNDPNEIQGIIHEAIKGFKRLYERQGFRKEILQNTQHIWNYSNNVIYQFIYNHCVKHHTFKTQVDLLFEAFKDKTDDTEISKGTFTKGLQKFGITKKQIRPSREYFYVGIKLKEDNPIENRLFTKEVIGGDINE